MDDEATLEEHLSHAQRFAAQTGAADAPVIADEVSANEEDERPTVAHAAWLRGDDYWKRTTYIAVTGRHTAVTPTSRPLPRPRRFRRPAPVRSVMVLALTIILIALIPIGAAIAAREGAARIKLPTNIPGFSQPTATPTVTPTATRKSTATPKK